MLKCFYLRCMSNQFFFTDSKIITVISRSVDILDNLHFLLSETDSTIPSKRRDIFGTAKKLASAFKKLLFLLFLKFN